MYTRFKIKTSQTRYVNGVICNIITYCRRRRSTSSSVCPFARRKSPSFVGYDDVFRNKNPVIYNNNNYECAHLGRRAKPTTSLPSYSGRICHRFGRGRLTTESRRRRRHRSREPCKIKTKISNRVPDAA